MKILLLGNYALDGQESMLRYASALQVALRAEAHEVTLLQPRAYFGRSIFLGTPLGKWLGYIDKFVLFPFVIRNRKKMFDIIHICDHSNAMWIPAINERRHVITCHDLLAVRSAMGAFPDNPTSRTGRLLQALIVRGLRSARTIICDSHATRSDVMRIVGPPPERVHCISLAMNYPYTPMDRGEAMRRLQEIGRTSSRPYFVHIGSNAWYKNRPGLLRIFAALIKHPQHANSELLLLGKPLSRDLLALMHALGLADRVQVYSDLSNEDLRAAYTLAEGLIFPSLHEGFGWPILEAQACGCPVFTTDLNPMLEVGGNAAVYFTPSRIDEAARIICDGLTSTDTMRQLGFSNIVRFSTDSMVAGYLRVYAEL